MKNHACVQEKLKCHKLRVSYNERMNESTYEAQEEADGKGCAWQGEVESMNFKGQSAATAGQNFHNIPLGLLALLLFDKSCRNLSRGRFQRYCRKPRLPPLYYWSCSIQGACCRCKSRPLLAWMPIQLASVFSHMAQASVAYFSTYLHFRASISLPSFHGLLPKMGLTKDALFLYRGTYSRLVWNGSDKTRFYTWLNKNYIFIDLFQTKFWISNIIIN